MIGNLAGFNWQNLLRLLVTIDKETKDLIRSPDDCEYFPNK